jgi:hypothetical protein
MMHASAELIKAAAGVTLEADTHAKRIKGNTPIKHPPIHFQTRER